MRTAFAEWVRRWNVGPSMNDRYRAQQRGVPAPSHYTGFDGTVGDGWIPILDDLARDLTALGWDGSVDQIKQKFGTLRFYLSGWPNADDEELMEQVESLIRRAENASAVICERCGSPGTVDEEGWWSIRCATCEDGGS